MIEQMLKDRKMDFECSERKSLLAMSHNDVKCNDDDNEYNENIYCDNILTLFKKITRFKSATQNLSCTAFSNF